MKTADLPAPTRARSTPAIIPVLSAAAAVAHPAAPAGTRSASETEGGTREAVVHLLMSAGPLTAAALADRLGLSAAGVRRHLDQLVEDGEVTARVASSPRGRGRGRPARAYLLTDVGRARFPHAYDEVAVQALRFLESVAGPAAVSEFARRWARSALAPHAAELAAAGDVAARSEVVTGALTEAGFAASLHQVGIGRQLCQHHCPVAHVAEEFPQFCEEEMHVLTDALGTYAQRIATIARGDSFCTTFIPRAVTGTPAAGPTVNPPTTTRPTSTDPSSTAAPHETAQHEIAQHETAPITSAPDVTTVGSAPLGRTSS